MAGTAVDSDCRREGGEGQAGVLGTPGAKCDAPIALAQKTLDWIGRTWRDKIDFVIWTGDNARHDWDRKQRRKRKHVYHLNELVADMMKQTFWPTARDPRHIPLVPTLGNNDVYPHNSMSADEADLLAYYDRLWQPWIPTDQRQVFRHGGYFGVTVGPRLRVLSLNTMYFFQKNGEVKGCHAISGPAKEQIIWFENELLKARHARHRVYVIGHVPPSPKHYRNSCLREYVRIASAFPDVLMGHFFGHLNMDHFLLLDARDGGEDDEFRRMDEDEQGEIHVQRNIEKYVDWLRDMYASIDPIDDFTPTGHRHIPTMPVVAVQVSPSVLPVYFPSIRIYRYEIHDDDDHPQCHHSKKPHGTLLGYDQYFANITSWEENLMEDPDSVPLEYEHEYSTQEAYGLQDLTVASYYDLAKRMIDSEGQDLWDNYIRNMFVQAVAVEGDDLDLEY